MCYQVRQRRSDLGVTAIYCVEVTVGGSRRCMAEAAHQVLDRRAGSGGKGLPGVPQLMEPESRHVDLAAGTVECLADGITPHALLNAPMSN
jgi:hypothetical protein